MHFVILTCPIVLYSHHNPDGPPMKVQTSLLRKALEHSIGSNIFEDVSGLEKGEEEEEDEEAEELVENVLILILMVPIVYL